MVNPRQPTRREFLSALAGGAAVGLSDGAWRRRESMIKQEERTMATEPENNPTRPNVVFILSDDQGPWAAG